MNEKIIKRIELDIDGVGISLTPEQARKLHGALAELLGVKPRKEFVPVPQPYPVPAKPRRPWPHEPWITWSTNGTADQCIKGVKVTYNTTANAVTLKV